MTIEWPKGGIITQRGKNTYYSHFFTVTDHVLSKQYATGSIISIIINKKTLLAEITHLWLYDGTTGYARLKLYSLPEDLPHGRTHYHGEHELLLFHKPVIMTCQQLLSIEQLGSHWSLGVPLQPPPHVSPPSPPLSSPPSPPTQSCSASTELLYCNETMVPVGGFHDGTGVSPASSPVISRCPNSIDSAYRLVIFSYAAYCRYRAVLKRFQPDPYSYMSYPLVQAMGGVSVPTAPTIALFCRKTFRDGTLERKLMTMEGGITADTRQVPNHVYTSVGLNESGEVPSKRKRGRPRKNDPPVPPPNPGKRRGPGRPRRHPLPEKKLKISSEVQENGLSSSSSSTSSNISSSVTSMQCNNSNSSELSQNDAISSSSEASDNQQCPLSPPEDIPRSLRPRERILPPPQFRDDSIYDTKLNFVDPPVIKKQAPPPPPTQPVSPPSPPPPPHSAPPAPPPPPPPPKPEKPPTNSMSSNPERRDTCIAINNYVQNQIIKEIKPQLPLPSNPLPPSIPTPPAPPAPPPTPLTISPDVRQLLRAHLLKAQHNGQSQAVLKDLDEHLMEEKPFLDLLFCFMRLRNTPIHKIPRLGSKYLNLYSLFHSTNRMGGYDQVTVNRKWSSVFDSMGYSTSMTCASTVTRKHYEKLLLPFEKALTAMKQAAAQRAQ